MAEDTLTAALEREHYEIDEGLEAFAAGVEVGEYRSDDLDRAAAALRRHIYLEEEFLFPPLRMSGLMAPVLVMLREHGEIWRTLDELTALAGADAERDDAATTERTRLLLGQLEAHNAKEEPIIYPEGDAKLDEAAKSALFDFIDAGTMPEGWVCAMAVPRGQATRG